MKNTNAKTDHISPILGMLQSLMGLSQASERSAQSQQEFPLQMEALRGQIAGQQAEQDMLPLREELLRNQSAGAAMGNVQEFAPFENQPDLLKQMLMRQYPWMADQMPTPQEKVQRQFGDSQEILNRARALASRDQMQPQ